MNFYSPFWVSSESILYFLCTHYPSFTVFNANRFNRTHYPVYHLNISISHHRTITEFTTLLICTHGSWLQCIITAFSLFPQLTTSHVYIYLLFLLHLSLLTLLSYHSSVVFTSYFFAFTSVSTVVVTTVHPFAFPSLRLWIPCFCCLSNRNYFLSAFMTCYHCIHNCLLP